MAQLNLILMPGLQIGLLILILTALLQILLAFHRQILSIALPQIPPANRLQHTQTTSLQMHQTGLKIHNHFMLRHKDFFPIATSGLLNKADNISIWTNKPNFNF